MNIHAIAGTIQEENRFTLFFDGCSKGNPGRGGSGAVLYEKDIGVWSASAYVGDRVTNNVAEYHGLILGLKEARDRGIKHVTVRGDSMLVVQQMRGEYTVRSANLRPSYNEAKALAAQFDTISFHHVYRDQNKRADALSNMGLEKA